MKKLILIFALTFATTMLSSLAYAEWTKVFDAANGDTHYLDFDNMIKKDGAIYYWTMTNFGNPSKYLGKSSKSYREGYCDVKRFRALTFLTYDEPMGKGTATPQKIPEQFAQWIYPPPDSSAMLIMGSVCIMAELL